MNLQEKKMADILIDLKNNYHIIGVKAEFETEGTTFEEAILLKKLTENAGINLTIKIGGCEAIKDMFEAKTIGANSIVAPMIETPYALEKYARAIKSVFSEEERTGTEFFINIETITGFNNLDDIISSPYFKDLSGIVLGRSDMVGSLGLKKNEVDSDLILNIANKIAMKMQSIEKEFTIGGNVSIESIPFFKKLPNYSLNKYETRKIVFDAKKALEEKNTGIGLTKAIEFELIWLQNKQNNYKLPFYKDTKRLQSLENQYKNLIDKNYTGSTMGN